MGRTVLVTGASGFLGSRVRALVSAALGSLGEPWRAIFTDRLPPRAGEGALAAGNFLSCDLAELSQVERLLAETSPDSVVHLAGALGGGASAELRDGLFRSNLMSTCNLLEGLRREGAGRGKRPQFVLASTGLIYGDQRSPFSEDLERRPPNDYSLSKMLAECTLEAYARQGIVRACVLRPAVLYGPAQGGDMFVPALISSLRSGRRFPMTAGAQRRDFVYVDDAARAVLMVVEKKSEGIYNVGSGRGIAIREVGEVIATMLGRPDLLGIGDLPYREHEVWDYVLDATRLRALGWMPETEIREGLLNTVRPGSKVT
jgi:nucleoside-diphosphate-sugar epimerase